MTLAVGETGKAGESIKVGFVGLMMIIDLPNVPPFLCLLPRVYSHRSSQQDPAKMQAGSRHSSAPRIPKKFYLTQNVSTKVPQRLTRPYIFQPDYISSHLSLFPPSQPHTPSGWDTLTRLLPQCLCTSYFLFPEHSSQGIFIASTLPSILGSNREVFPENPINNCNSPCQWHCLSPSPNFIFSLQLLSPSSTLWLPYLALFHCLSSPS